MGAVDLLVVEPQRVAYSVATRTVAPRRCAPMVVAHDGAVEPIECQAGAPLRSPQAEIPLKTLARCAAAGSAVTAIARLLVTMQTTVAHPRGPPRYRRYKCVEATCGSQARALDNRGLGCVAGAGLAGPRGMGGVHRRERDSRRGRGWGGESVVGVG